MSKYAEQYKSPKWQQLRLRRFEAAGFKCSKCGYDDGQLHLHHKRYIKGRDVWDYDDSDLVVLCDQCHENAHIDIGLLNGVIAAIGLDKLVDAASILCGIYVDERSEIFHVVDEVGDPIGLHIGLAIKKRLLNMTMTEILKFEASEYGSV